MDRETMPNGQIGEPGVGISLHGLLNAIGLSVMLWLVGAMAVFYALRFVHWMLRG